VRVALVLLAAIFSSRALPADNKVVLVVTADAGDYILAAGGTIATMVAGGATAYLVRVTNDEKDSWDLPAEEAARRTSDESRQAAKILRQKGSGFARLSRRRAGRRFTH
jgi:hypothetical protein